MQFGDFEIRENIFGSFRLDGGSMFGSVPKNLWQRRIAADQENCITLAQRSLVIAHSDRVFLIDVGMGEKWNEKQRQIFAVSNTEEAAWSFKREEITDVVLTHLHFDHAGGISSYDSSGELALNYPNARVYVQRANFENALKPNLKERASYLPENVKILEAANLELLDGDSEIYPGISVKRVDGHTTGQQVIRIESGDRTLLFPTDLIPTSHHVSVPFHMGYDICAATILREKEEFLSEAIKSDALIVFQHDLDIVCGRIGRDERGSYCLKESSKSLPSQV